MNAREIEEKVAKIEQELAWLRGILHAPDAPSVPDAVVPDGKATKGAKSAKGANGAKATTGCACGED